MGMSAYGSSRKRGMVFLIGRQEGRLTSVGFSPDGRHIATANDTGIARIWDLELRVEVFKLTGSQGNEPILSLDYLNDPEHRYHRLVTAQGDTVKVWRPNWGALIEYLTDISRACLSVEEREIYLMETRNEAKKNATACRASVPPANRMVIYRVFSSRLPAVPGIIAKKSAAKM